MSTSIKPLKKVLVSNNFGIDEVVALYILRKFGEGKYKDLDKLKVEFRDTLPRGKNRENLLEENILTLGIPRGIFVSGGRRIEESLSYQIAKYLEIEKQISIRRMLEYVSWSKVKRSNLYIDALDNTFGMSNMLESVRRHSAETSNKVIKSTDIMLDAFIKNEVEKEKRCTDDYMKKFDDRRVDAFVVQQDKRKLRCIIIDSDVLGIPSFLYDHESIEADVVVQIFSTGHMIIVTKSLSKVNLQDVVAAVRIEEARKKKIPFDELNLKGLFCHGKLKDIEEWYFDTVTNSLMNGGYHAEGTKPTNLNRNDIRRLLKIGLNYRSVNPQCSKSGKCLGKKCKIYYYGYLRCKQMKADYMQNEEKSRKKK